MFFTKSALGIEECFRCLSYFKICAHAPNELVNIVKTKEAQYGMMLHIWLSNFTVSIWNPTMQLIKLELYNQFYLIKSVPLNNYNNFANVMAKDV